MKQSIVFNFLTVACNSSDAIKYKGNPLRAVIYFSSKSVTALKE